jgi:guanylate kinase
MQHYDEFDYLVGNDDFEIALNELSTIIHSQTTEGRGFSLITRKCFQSQTTEG